MPQFDLSARKTAAWRERLPEDLQALLPPVAAPAPVDAGMEEALVALGHDLSTAGTRNVPEVIRANRDLLVRADRAAFMRVVVFAINRTQPDSASMSRLMAEEDGGDGDEGAFSPFAELYRETWDVASKICRSRVVRASSDREVVSSVDAGVREFSENIELTQLGGM